jgi:hypothetical protein
MKLYPFLTPYIKVNSKYGKGVNTKPKTIELLEENIKENLHDIRCGNDVLVMTPKAQATIVKMENKTTPNLKYFCVPNDTIDSKKAIYRIGENICKSYI